MKLNESYKYEYSCKSTVYKSLLIFLPEFESKTHIYVHVCTHKGDVAMKFSE